MSNTGTFSVNDMVFVENIGYGTLMDCGQLKSISIKQLPALGQKKQSIYFDPQLFNSEFDTLGRQKSEPSIIVVNHKSQEKKQEPKSEVSQENDQKLQNSLSIEKVESKPKQQKKLNIVKVRLEGNNALVYTPDTNIRKNVIVPVRPLFLPAIGTLNIKIQIGKTIESFKKEIFQLLGLKSAHYFNVKLFTTSPNLSELNCPGKTIWQCGIKQSSTLTMTAQHGFCFQAVPPALAQSFSVTNNNLTFVSLPKKPKVAQNIIIALPAPVATQANEVVVPVKVQPNIQPVNQPIVLIEQIKPAVVPVVQNQKKEEQPTQPTATEEKAIEKKEPIKQKVQQKKQIQVKEEQVPEFIYVKGDKYVKSGRHYFEVRLDKLPLNNNHLQIGITDNGIKKWLFAPLTLQKIYKQNDDTKSTQSYGMSFKQNDIIGVQVKIDKQKQMRVNFFKNSVNLGECFEQKVSQIGFVFGIGSECQISLDTRAQIPIDSYRYR